MDFPDSMVNSFAIFPNIKILQISCSFSTPDLEAGGPLPAFGSSRYILAELSLEP